MSEPNPTSTKNDDLILREAERRVFQRLEFYKHLAAYLGVNIGLLLINHFLTPEKLWFFWVLGGWGLGVLLHAFIVFGPRPSGDWKKRLIEEEVRKIQNETPKS